jgi:hypothetical protein
VTESSSTSDGWAPRSARLLENLGFTLDHEASDLPRGGADLHVALRDRPTLRHFDPEVIAYWVERSGRGRHAYLDRAGTFPHRESFEWGDVRIADRLGETNRYLVFGGEVSAAEVDESLVVVRFRSSAPILRAGGHSQGVDPLEPDVGAFFGRVMIPVDFTGGAEEKLAAIDPAGLYAAFVADTERRLGGGRRGVVSPALEHVRREATRLRAELPAAWAAGMDLLRSLGLAGQVSER